jgi:hypothetical protein
MAQGCVIDQPFAARSPAGGLGPVGLYRGLIDKADPRLHVCHEGLAPLAPDVARGGDLGALLLDSLQVFLLCVRPRLCNIPQTEPR